MFYSDAKWNNFILRQNNKLWGHTDAKRVTLFKSTEEHKDGLDKDGEAGEVSSISEAPELQEPTASSSASNTVIQLCLGDVSCSKFQTQTIFGMTQ